MRSLCSYKVDRDVTLERCEALHAAEAVRQRVQTADPNTRLRWSEWFLTPSGLEDVLAESMQWETQILGAARFRGTSPVSSDNARACNAFVYRATRILHQWLNRKSQRKAYTWAELNQALRWVGWPRVHIRIDLNPFRRAEAC